MPLAPYTAGQAVEAEWDGGWLLATVKGEGETGVMITWEDGSMSDMPLDQMRPAGGAAAAAGAAAAPAAPQQPAAPQAGPGSGVIMEMEDDAEDAEDAAIHTQSLPDKMLPDSDAGMSDAVKQAHVLPARVENKRILEINDHLLREVKKLRLMNGRMKQQISGDRLKRKMAMEAKVRSRVNQQEQKQRVEAAQNVQQVAVSECSLNLDPGSLLNHLCHLRGWKFPGDEYRAIPLPRSGMGKGQRLCEYVCVFKLSVKNEEGKLEVQEFEGDRQPQKKEAKQSAIKKMILAHFPECESWEECQQKIAAEHVTRKKKNAGKPPKQWGGKGWGRKW